MIPYRYDTIHAVASARRSETTKVGETPNLTFATPRFIGISGEQLIDKSQFRKSQPHARPSRLRRGSGATSGACCASAIAASRCASATSSAVALSAAARAGSSLGALAM
jgi:hypothetical protein